MRALIWVDSRAAVLMNASALQVAASRFGTLPAVPVLQLPTTSRLVVTGQYAGAIGKEEADTFF